MGQVFQMKWLWPMIVLFSTIAVALAVFALPAMPLRPLIVMWFLFVCPGMTIVQLFLSVEPVVMWTLALALSFSVDALVAGIQVYTGHWSPPATLIVLMVFCLIMVIVQIVRPQRQMVKRG